jgi:hypothetical protein
MFVKAALRQGLSEVEMPPKAAPKSTPKQLHFHSYIDIRSNIKERRERGRIRQRERLLY